MANNYPLIPSPHMLYGGTGVEVKGPAVVVLSFRVGPSAHTQVTELAAGSPTC